MIRGWTRVFNYRLNAYKAIVVSTDLVRLKLRSFHPCVSLQKSEQQHYLKNMLIASLKNYFKFNERLLARPVCHGNSMMRDRFKCLTERKIVTAKKTIYFS